MARTLTFRPREERSAGRMRTVWMSLACTAGGLLLGFEVAGWMSDGAVQRQAEQAAANARLQLAAAVCAERFMQQADAPSRLAKLAALGRQERSKLLAEGGWATMPDRKAPSSEAAMRCGIELGERYTAVHKATPISVPAK